jgi:hypothetical protein
MRVASMLVLVLSTGVAAAKDYGYRSPGGRQITTMATRSRVPAHPHAAAIEAAVGAGPEGNIAALIGLLNQPVRGIDLFAGIGWELNPARHYTIGARYTPNFDGYRPYIGIGYLYNDLYVLCTWSHNVFAEAGYCWVIHETYRLTAGVGIRYIAHIGIRTTPHQRPGQIPSFSPSRRTILPGCRRLHFDQSVLTPTAVRAVAMAKHGSWQQEFFLDRLRWACASCCKTRP